MFIASHTMPGPSSEEINLAFLLTLPGSVLLACLLIVLLNPNRSLVRRALGAVVGFAVGTVAMFLFFWIAALLAIALSVIAKDMALSIVVAAGVVLFAIFGAFGIAMSARVTQAMCCQWMSDLFATRVPASGDRRLAIGWAVGLLLGLIATLATDRFVLLGIGAVGGTLLGAGRSFRQRPGEDWHKVSAASCEMPSR